MLEYLQGNVKGIKNDLADSLSRDKIEEFKKLCTKKGKSIEHRPTVVPEILWPMEKVWLK